LNYFVLLNHVEEMLDTKTEPWKRSNLQVFWRELASSEHIVQLYENDKVFLDSLEGFAGSGILAGEAVVLIATEEHLNAIKKRLVNHGFDIASLIASDRFIGLDASETLSKFMVNNWPDEQLFFETVKAVFKRAQRNSRKVRAFGEMVAVLWKEGFKDATVQLENLWNQFHKKGAFSLFCAYPKLAFTQDSNTSIHTICCEHSKIIDGSPRPSTEIYYKAVGLS
jgi:hypothetical protein